MEVVGEPGSGKSALLTELAWRAQLAGAEVVRAGAGGRGRPFAAIASALDQVAARTDRQSPIAPDRAASRYAATPTPTRRRPTRARRMPEFVLHLPAAPNVIL